MPFGNKGWVLATVRKDKKIYIDVFIVKYFFE